ncbi:unnamed protein product [Chrysoparadoxa australica]
MLLVSLLLGGESDLLPQVGILNKEDAGMQKEFLVSLKADGSVVVAPEVGFGLKWRLEPGPTHLDTVVFELISTSLKEEGVLLSYTGYAQLTLLTHFLRESVVPSKLCSFGVRIIAGLLVAIHVSFS